MKSGSPHIRWTRTVVACVLLLGGVAAADDVPTASSGNLHSATVEASVDRTEITIGDRIHYWVTVEYDDGVELRKPGWGEGLESFQILDFEQGKKEKIGNRWKVTDTYILSTFTPEDYVIPPLRVPITLPSGATQVLETQPIAITVKSVLPDDEDAPQLREVKDPVPVYAGILTGRVIAALVALLAVLAFLFAVWRYKKKGEEPVVSPPPRPEDEMALERLARLRTSVLEWEEIPDVDRCKQFALELSEILREYLERRFGFIALEMTTYEIELHLATHPVEGSPDAENLNDEITEILRQTDLMKFAKVTQPVEWMEKTIERCESIIRATRRQTVLTESAVLDEQASQGDGSPNEEAA